MASSTDQGRWLGSSLRGEERDMTKPSEPPQYAPWSTDPDPPLQPMTPEQAREAVRRVKELTQRKGQRAKSEKPDEAKELAQTFLETEQPQTSGRAIDRRRSIALMRPPA